MVHDSLKRAVNAQFTGEQLQVFNLNHAALLGGTTAERRTARAKILREYTARSER